MPVAARATRVAIASVVAVGLVAIPTARLGAGFDTGSPTITVTKIRLVDDTRSTPASPGHPAEPRRVLVTTVRVPRDAAGALAAAHPLPLIVVAHGLNGDPHQLDELLDSWAKAGFVVAAPRLPRVTLDHGRALAADAAAYPADLSFVVSRLVALGGPAGEGPLRGRIDPSRVGAAGVSLGGQAVYGLISNTCCLDARIRAAVLMSAVRRPFPTGQYQRQDSPVLLVHGDADVGYHHSLDAYADLAPPKWFVTLRKGEHGPPFEDEPSEHDELVQVVTVAFWDRYLLGDRGGPKRMVKAVRSSDGAATLRRVTG